MYSVLAKLRPCAMEPRETEKKNELRERSENDKLELITKNRFIISRFTACLVTKLWSFLMGRNGIDSEAGFLWRDRQVRSDFITVNYKGDIREKCFLIFYLQSLFSKYLFYCWPTNEKWLNLLSILDPNYILLQLLWLWQLDNPVNSIYSFSFLFFNNKT